MTKQEFLKVLQASLSGKITDAQVADHLRYYDEYISTEIQSGRSEADVMDSLGDPRLIARSILTAGAQDDNGRTNTSTGGNEYYGSQNEAPKGYKTTGVPAWGWLIVVIFVMMVLLSAVFSVIKLFLPVLLPILMVVFFVKLFRDWLN